MKNLKTLSLFLVLFHLQAHAGLPSEVEKNKSISFNIKVGRLSLVKQKGLDKTESSLIFSTASLNAAYVSGLKKKEESSSLEGILKWDFKVKFRLNKNMNIMFSYN